MFKIGQEVTITGKLVKAHINMLNVDAQVERGITVITKRNEVVTLETPKKGIIVGCRNYVDQIVHKPGEYGRESVPKSRKKAYLVALNMRDTYKVPEEHIIYIDPVVRAVDEQIRNAHILVDFNLVDTSLRVYRRGGKDIARIDTGDHDLNYLLAEEICKELGEPYAFTY